MPPWRELRRDGVRLAVRDFGGTGAAALLVHGLAGHAGEWDALAARLTARFRVLAFDQRGHGRSERRPHDVTRGAFVADTVAVIEELALAPVLLIGQSMGGHTALLVAAAHPQLVDGLVVVEASPDGPSPDLPGRIRGWLDRWPVPFADRATAHRFFAEQGFAAEPWVDGLEPGAGGLRPAFEPDVLVAAVADMAAREHWGDWRRIRCPVLVVRGDRGHLDAVHLAALTEAVSAGSAVSVAGAGHDVHLDAPAALADAIIAFAAQYSFFTTK